MRGSKLGIILTIAGAALALVSGIVLAVQGQPSAITSDRAEVPNPVEFYAQGGEYRLLLLSQPTGTPGAQLDCTVYLADGTTMPVALGDTFQPPVGLSIATCELVSGGGDVSNYVYGVAPVIPAIAIASIAGLVVGLLAFGVGLILTIVGRRTGTGKRVAGS